MKVLNTIFSFVILVLTINLQSQNNNCSGIIKDKDGNQYKTIKIGSQCWMAENLKTMHYDDGTAISGYFAYNNDTSYVKTYGLLYTWWAAMKNQSEDEKNKAVIQGVCPEGWHIPSDAEWRKLELKLGINVEELNKSGWRGTSEGGKLKSKDLWMAPNLDATNESGFSALPGGSKKFDGSFSSVEINGFFWTTSQLYGLTSWGRGLSATSGSIYRFSEDPDAAFSIRCIKDK